MYTVQCEKWMSMNILTWEDGDGNGNTQKKTLNEDQIMII